MLENFSAQFRLPEEFNVRANFTQNKPGGFRNYYLLLGPFGGGLDNFVETDDKVVEIVSSINCTGGINLLFPLDVNRLHILNCQTGACLGDGSLTSGFNNEP